MDILKKNLFPAHLIERVVNRYVTGTLSNHIPRVSLPSSPTFYFKLPYVGHFSVVTEKRATATCIKGEFYTYSYFHTKLSMEDLIAFVTLVTFL